MIANGVRDYFDGKIVNVVVAVVLLSALGIVHHLLSLVFFSAKMVVKLPIVHSLDKLLGIVFGAAEVVLVLWTVYAFIMMLDVGAIGRIILSYTEESRLLLWLYQHNYVAQWIEKLLEEFNFIPLEELQTLLDGVIGKQ